MNNDYHMLRLEEAKMYQEAQLLEMYNDAVETIWELQRIKQELKEEIALWREDLCRESPLTGAEWNGTPVVSPPETLIKMQNKRFIFEIKK